MRHPYDVTGTITRVQRGTSRAGQAYALLRLATTLRGQARLLAVLVTDQTLEANHQHLTAGNTLKLHGHFSTHGSFLATETREQATSDPRQISLGLSSG